MGKGGKIGGEGRKDGGREAWRERKMVFIKDVDKV